MLSEPDRVGLETALYNLDQPVVLKRGATADAGSLDEIEYAAYREGLRRGAVEALAMVLGLSNDMNALWGNGPLRHERGKYGRYPD